MAGNAFKQHLCQCGEYNPENFYGNNKGVCKLCYKLRANDYQKANRKEATKRQTEWKRNNRDRARELNQESRKRNLRTHTMKEQRRRANTFNQFVEDVDPLVLLELDDGICGICGNDIDPFNYHVDHIIPLSKGGMHSYLNTQIAHPHCNIQKGCG